MISDEPDLVNDELYDMVNKISDEQPTEESIDNARRRDLGSVGRQRGVIRRTTIKALESRWLVSIRTYFQLLKHTANLPADDKMRHLFKAADSSELFIKGLTTKRAHIGTQPTYYYSGIVITVELSISTPWRKLIWRDLSEK